MVYEKNQPVDPVQYSWVNNKEVENYTFWACVDDEQK